jgi:hypothetical protein
MCARQLLLVVSWHRHRLPPLPRAERFWFPREWGASEDVRTGSAGAVIYAPWMVARCCEGPGSPGSSRCADAVGHHALPHGEEASTVQDWHSWPRSPFGRRLAVPSPFPRPTHRYDLPVFQRLAQDFLFALRQRAGRLWTAM